MRLPRPERSVAAAAALLCVVLVGCAGPRLNMWPVYFQETQQVGDDPGQRVTTVEIAYPFFSLSKFAQRYWFAVRPLFNYESNAGEDSHRLQYLWPLGLQKGEGERRWYHILWPVFMHTRAQRPSGEKQTHGFVFPLVFWGSKAPEGVYFALFPVAGVTHGLVADTFSFVAFPLYSYFRQGEYRRHNIAWPFFTIGGTPDGRQKLLRIWPLYVHSSREGAWDHHFLLWPFIRWGSQQWSAGDRQYRRTYSVFHPFYLFERTHDAEGKLVAYRSKAILGTKSWEERDGEEYRSWTFLWTLMRDTEAPRKTERAFIPFFWWTKQYPGGRESGRTWTRTRLLWPIVWVDSRVEADRKDTAFILAPLLWHYKTRYTAGDSAGKTDRRITLWPLVTWERQHDGAWRLNLLSSGWRDRSEGAKRNYRPLFELFQISSDPQEGKETRLLWRLYHHKRGPRGRYLSFGPLATYDGIGDAGAEGRKSFSCLFGLVKYYWREEGSHWRILYVPLGGD